MNYSVIIAKKLVGNFKIETSKIKWVDECIALRSKAYSFKCDDENTNKLKRFSKSYLKNVKFEEYEKCLDAEEYQKESVNYILNSIIHEMYLQKKTSLPFFDCKSNYLNNTECLPWNLMLIK